MDLKESREHVHLRMSRVAQKDTALEIALRRKLHAAGLRFKKNVRSLPGAPDVVFASRQLVVFVDGDFWHGYTLPRLRGKISQYWIDKITRTIERDNENTTRLESLGWQVIRVWGHEIEQNLEDVVQKIKVALGVLPEKHD